MAHSCPSPQLLSVQQKGIVVDTSAWVHHRPSREKDALSKERTFQQDMKKKLLEITRQVPVNQEQFEDTSGDRMRDEKKAQHREEKGLGRVTLPKTKKNSMKV